MKQQLKLLILSLGLASFAHSSAFADTDPNKKICKPPLSQEAKSEVQPTPQDVAVRINGPAVYPQAGTSYLPIDLDVPGQSFVSTGPYLGVPLQYSGSNLIINNPTIYEDVSLLRLRQNINKRLAELGVCHPGQYAHLLLSGMVQAQAFYRQGGISSNASDINLTNVNLDGYVLGPSSWTSGLMSFAFENNIGANSGIVTSYHRVSNSRVFVNEAFAIIGDFSQSPFYGTAGQMYVPFGRYNSNFITNPVTKTLARTKDRALLVGYQQRLNNAFYTAAYIFRGDSYVPSTKSRVNNGGVDMGYRFGREQLYGDFGGGVIGNMADSIGMQITGNNPLFNGFGSNLTSCGSTGTSSCGNEQLVHRVPAYDVRGLFAIGDHWNLVGEYIMASTNFNPTDLSYNSHGARPQALNAEAAYTFTAFERPNTIAAGYGMTQQALAIGLPAKRYSLVMNTSIWRQTLQSLELRHDIDYSASATSSGADVPGPTGTGHSDNVITAQFSIYF